MDFMIQESDAVEVQVLADDDNDNGKTRCLVFPASPSASVHSNKLPVKSRQAAYAMDSDEATARTEVSTEIDEMSLRDVGTFNSLGSSFDTSRIAITRSRQGDLLSIAESNGAKNDQSGECPDAMHSSLLDLDEDDDDSSGLGVKTTLGNKLFSESQADFYGVGQSSFTSAGSIVGDTLYSESRADFYSGYDCRPTFTSVDSIDGNILLNSESRAEFYGARVRSTSPKFPDGTLDTGSRIGFYRVRCSDTEEPLSCHQKLEQPALSCDETLWDGMKEGGQKKEEKRKVQKKHDGEDRTSSVFSAITCCFTPTQP